MAGNVVSNVKKYYGGQVPVPGQGDSDGKVKMLVEKTATMEIEGVQTEVELLYDADDLTTPVTPQQLGQWTDENYLIAFKKREDDGRVRGFVLYALSTESTSTDTLVNRAEFISFKEDMNDPGASAYEFTMVEDSSTLTRYLRDENGELIVKFNQATVEAGAQSGTLDNLIGSDSEYMHFEVVHDENNNAYLNLNTESLDGELDDIYDYLDNIWDIVNAGPSDEHGYFKSSLIQTPGDGTTENIIIDDFRISQGGDVHGESIEFVPTHQEGGVDFGEVYLNPGTYIFTVHYTLQWVGNPRGTFLPLVTNVGDRPFDFSYEHEDVVRTTRIVTRTTRGKFSLGFPIDADTPQMGIWVKNLEIAQIASYNHPAVAHDTTLAGTGKLDSPLGVTPAAFGKVKDIPTSISQFRTGDVIPVDGPNGPAKMDKDDLLTETAQNALAGNVAPAFDPNKPNDAGGYAYYTDEIVSYNGVTYRFKVNHSSGAWNATEVDKYVANKELECLSIVENSEYVIAFVDHSKRFLFGVKKDGSFTWNKGASPKLDELFVRFASLDTFISDTITEEDKTSPLLYAIRDSSGGVLFGLNDRAEIVNDNLYKTINEKAASIVETAIQGKASVQYVDSKVSTEKDRALAAEQNLQTAIENINPTIVEGGSNNPDNIFLTAINDAITLKDFQESLYSKAIKYIHPSRSVDFSASNTIYVIAGGVNLNGGSLVMPSGCELLFMPSGSMYNGTINGNATKISGWLKSIFAPNLTINGTWNCPKITSAMSTSPHDTNALMFINNLLDDSIFNDVIIEAGDYYFKPTSGANVLLNLKSNTRLHIVGTIHTEAHGLVVSTVVSSANKVNIEVYGGVIEGDIDTHDYSASGTHEQNHLVVFSQGSQKIHIHDMALNHATGDALYLSATDVNVCNLSVYKSGRNCISITSGGRIHLSNLVLDYCKRTAPKAAIDIEPNSGKVDNVHIENIKILDCDGGFVAQNCNNLSVDGLELEASSLIMTIDICDGVIVQNARIHSQSIDAATLRFNLSSKRIVLRNVAFESEVTPSTQSFNNVLIDPSVTINNGNILPSNPQVGSTSVRSNALVYFNGSAWV